MIFDWIAIISTILYKHPEQLPAILKNDSERMNKKDIQFETVFFKWLQERYEYCSNYEHIQICAIIQAFVLDGAFWDFAYAIYWPMKQPAKEGGLEFTDMGYAIEEFYNGLLGEDEFKEAVSDPDNIPTPIGFARLGYEYRFYVRYQNSLQEFKEFKEEDEH